ncbi:OsmC family protein [Pseudomonas sp. 8209]|uniref:OsmC family protein n=1 Tax=Pseudomonas TaxID=286 RepID=UPI0023640800|nr:OsmC family protein [Pseudomonas sp. 8209]MDD1955684.1 OsmC family protein [Pseudomonas sp. 8209]
MNNIVNGIDVTNLENFAREVAADDTKAEVRFNVQTKWMGQTKSVTNVTQCRLAGRQIARDFQIVSDEPVELLGENTAPGPMELLLAALNACMSVGYATGAAARGIKIKSLEIETDTNLDLRGFLGLDESLNPGINEINYKVKICADAPQHQIEELHAHVIKTSPNFHNMAREIKVSPKLEII